MIELLTQKLTDLEHPMLMSNPVCLSHREREILQWTADGKSSGEIAIILSISESTVNFHHKLSLIHISEPTRHFKRSRMPSSA